MTLEQASQEHWDYIIIGTGIAGSTFGWSLANRGKKILYIEKGLSSNFKKGLFPESQLKDFENPTAHEIELLKSFGRYSEYVTDESHAPAKKFIPLLGQGAGGSTLLYGAALERFFPEDFFPKKYFTYQKEASLAEWPITYDDLEKYYIQAEQLYKVYGGVDPLRINSQNHSLLPVKMSIDGQSLSNFLTQKGLHPYRLPVGHKPRELSECNGCQAIICICDDKSDAAQITLFPSLSLGSSHLLDNCEVLKLECSYEKVKSVEVKRDSEIKLLGAKKIILAAGVLNTTKILLNSKNEIWPFGLGNHSGLVGKNLCRHYMDLLMINNKPTLPTKKYEKEIAINDFYINGEEKLGTIQSLGNPPSFETVLYEMYSEFGRSGSLFNKIYYQLVKKFGRRIVNNLFQKKYCLATIMEDVSYQDNQVYINSSGELSICYKIHPFEKKRISKFRELCRHSFRELKPELHKQAENNQRLAHASGTCRMGNDRRISVVDKANRVHDIENLYIIDASFFPSSAGINPALTIAANALRVADLIES